MKLIDTSPATHEKVAAALGLWGFTLKPHEPDSFIRVYEKEVQTRAEALAARRSIDAAMRDACSKDAKQIAHVFKFSEASHV